MKMIYDLDFGKCVGCGACAVACMDQNDLHPERGDRFYRTVGNTNPSGDSEKIIFFSIGCMHCDDARCIDVCPHHVFQKNEAGITIYDNSFCIGCRRCLVACPYKAPTFGVSGKMEKCNGCSARIKYGLLPACVRVCPTGALACMTEEEYESSDHMNSLRRTGKNGFCGVCMPE